MRTNIALIFCLFLGISFASGSLPCEESEIQYKCGESAFSTDYEGSFNLQKYCMKNGTPLVEIINCSNGCIDGACINETLILCEDTDGGNEIYKKGVLTDNFHRGEIHEDTCVNANSERVEEGSTLVEMYCTELREITGSYGNGRRYTNQMSVVSFDKIECETGCANGACLEKESNNYEGTLPENIQGIVNNSNVKIMPETASQTAIDRLGELNFSIELKEVGAGNETKLIYEARAKKQGRFLGLFKITGEVQVQIDADTGEIISTKKPWWAFLASGI